MNMELDNNKTIELDHGYIKQMIKEVLERSHKDDRKHVIKEFPERLNYSCPICGDSDRAPGRKLRGNLYYKNMMHICFNEGCNMSFLKLLKTFNINIDLEQKINIYNYVDANVKYAKDDNYVIQRLDKLINIKELEDFFNNDPSSKYINFRPIKKNSRQYQYLKYDRLIDDHKYLYEADHVINPKWHDPVIISMNMSGGKVLAMQSRNLKPSRFFNTYNFERLYNMLHPNDPLDEIEALSYNRISNFYNILNVNWDKPVTIFEGFLDSIFYPNSLGAIGINSTDDMDFLLQNDDGLKLNFFYDQDYIGIKKSLTRLNEGHSVFLWQKLNQLLMTNKKDKYDAERYLLKIKDLNKLVQEMKNPDAYNKLKLWEYFSTDEFDKMYLDIKKYNKPVFKDK